MRLFEMVGRSQSTASKWTTRVEWILGGNAAQIDTNSQFSTKKLVGNVYVRRGRSLFSTFLVFSTRRENSFRKRVVSEEIQEQRVGQRRRPSQDTYLVSKVDL